MLGLIQVYTGNGKGKTTASIGLAIRALGAGKSVALVQFDKGFDGENEHYSERKLLRQLPNITLYPTGCERIRPDGTFRFGVTPEDLKEAQRGLRIAKKLIREGDQFLLILDEILAAVAYKLLERKDVMEIVALHKQVGNCEMVLTGHTIWDELKEQADLVTHMTKIKHYYDRGVPARLGIEF